MLIATRSPETGLTDVVDTIEVLSAEECAQTVNTLHGLRQHWVSRTSLAPFYTLGAASYLDATNRNRRYKNWTEMFNPVLQENFGALYEKVLTAVEKATGEPAVYAPGLALPGFHIYLSSPVFEQPVASIHCDSQFNLHAWPEGADLHAPISFTVSIALPERGGGLYTWNISADEVASDSQTDLAKLMQDRQRTFHPYRTGHMAIHAGTVLHQAAPGQELREQDTRITLQGHGIRVNGTWQLYW